MYNFINLNRQRVWAFLFAIVLILNSTLPINNSLFAEEQFTNIIVNGDFETLGVDEVPVHWQPFAVDGGTGSITTATNEGKSGNAAQIVTDNAYAISTAENDVITVKPSTVYMLSYWLKSTGDTASFYPFVRQLTSLMDNTSENTYYSLANARINGTSDWTKVEVNFTTASDCERVYFWLLGNKGTFLIDDVKLIEKAPVLDDALIKNGGFEFGVNGAVPDSWQGFGADGGAGSVSKADGLGFTGSSAKITAISGSFFVTQTDDKFIQVEAATKYLLSYMIKIPDSGVTVSPMIRQLNSVMGNTSENTYYGLSQYIKTGSTEWQKVEVEFTTAPDAKFIYSWLIVTGGTVYLDDVTLSKYVAPMETGIKNSNFERVEANGIPSDWSFSSSIEGANTLTMDANGYSGKSVKISRQGSESSYSLLQLSENYPIKPNTTYQFSYYVKTENAQTSRQYVTIRQFTSDASFTGTNTYLTPKTIYGNTEWKQVFIKFTTEGDAEFINLWFMFTDQEGLAYNQTDHAIVWYDSVSLVETEPLTPEETLGFDIGNGDFPDNWITSYLGERATDITFDWIEGYNDKAVRVTKNTDTGAGVLISTTLQVESSTNYELSYWIKAQGNASAASYVFFHQYTALGDAENAYLWPSTNFWQYGSYQWKKITIPITTSRNAEKLDIRFVNTGDMGSFVCYDTVALTKLSNNINLDFESVTQEGNPENWYYAASQDTTASMNIDNDVSYSGSNSVHMTRKSGRFPFSLSSAIFIPVNSGDHYEISYFMKSKGSVDARAKLDFVVYDKKDEAVSTMSTIQIPISGAKDATEWKQYKMTTIVPGIGVKGRFSFIISPGVGEVWIDNITIKKVKTISNEIVYWDDFNAIYKNNELRGWDIIGRNATLISDNGSAKLTTTNTNSFMTAKMTAFRPSYTYRVTGRYKTTADTKVTANMRYYDTNYREMTTLTDNKTLEPSTEWNEFSYLVQTPSCTTAQLEIGTEAGSIWVDDLEITVANQPTDDSSWKGKWVWYSENASISAVRVSRYFRYTFELEDAVDTSIMQITVDDKFVLYINGVEVDSEFTEASDTWPYPHVLNIAKYLKKGKNVFAIRAYNVVSSAGVIFDARTTLKNGLQIISASDSSVKCSTTLNESWETTNYNDSQWINAVVIGSVPVLPWGNLYFDNTNFVDYAMEIIDTTTTSKTFECGTNATITMTLKPYKRVADSTSFTIYMWKRNSLVRVTTTELKIADGSDPSKWEVGKEVAVTFTMAIPQFINEGGYTLQFDQNKVAIINEDIYDNKFMDIKVVRDTESDELVSTVETHNGKPTLMINGKPESYLAFLLPVSQRHMDEKEFPNMAKKGGVNLFMTFSGQLGSKEGNLWEKDGTPNYALLDTVILQALSFNPNGYLMINFDIQAPTWWEEQNPDEMSRNSKGETKGYSLTSQKFRKEAGAILKLLIEHAKNQSYFSKVYGIRLTGAQTAEWLSFSNSLNTAVDFAVCAQTGFKTWLKEKYATVVALRNAWNNNTVTFETAQIPPYEERTSSVYIGLLDAATQKNIVDYQDYLGNATADTFLYFSKIAKEASDRKLVVGGYYGYVWNFYSYEANGNAHTSVGRILASNDVDFIAAPELYGERDLGLASSFMAMVDSVHANGKLFIQEQDNRTVKAETMGLTDADSAVGKSYTMEDTINQLKRDYANDMIKGAGLWFYQMYRGWFTGDDQIYETVKQMKGESDFSLNVNKKSTSDVAVFVGEKSYQYSTYDFGSTYQLYYHLYEMQRQNLGTMGAPYDMYNLSDLTKGIVPDHKINIMLSPYQLTEKEKAAIDIYLKKDNKVVVWVYLPGITDGNTNNIDFVSKITGIDLSMKAEKRNLNVTIADTDSIYTNGLAGVCYGTNSADAGPYVYVTDNEAKVLGYLNDSEDVGLASKDMGKWTSIYSAAPNLSNSFFTNIIESVGGHIYSSNRDDVIYANNHYVSLHSGYKGTRSIALPYSSSVYDVFGEKFISMNTQSFDVSLRDGESKLFRLMTPNTYAVTITSNNGGTVSPYGLTEVKPSSDMTVTIKQDNGYLIESVQINGVAQSNINSKFVIADIKGNISVKVVFGKIKIRELLTPTVVASSNIDTGNGDNTSSQPDDVNTSSNSTSTPDKENSNPAPEKEYRVVTTRIESGLDTWVIVLIILGSVLLLGIATFLVLFKRKKKRYPESNLSITGELTRIGVLIKTKLQRK